MSIGSGGRDAATHTGNAEQGRVHDEGAVDDGAGLEVGAVYTHRKSRREARLAWVGAHQFPGLGVLIEFRYLKADPRGTARRMRARRNTVTKSARWFRANFEPVVRVAEGE